ncbi:MAG: hypothetical protein GXO48_03060, partial [Chlorobi bacterium]|nr:hypothetical protein [Chlorobiota bacterium]
MIKKWTIFLAFLIGQPMIAQHFKGSWEVNYRSFWQDNNLLYWSYVQGEILSSIGGVPMPLNLGFKWYPLYRKGLPLELALKFNRNEMDRWLTRQIRSYTAGVNDLIWIQRNAQTQLQQIATFQNSKMLLQERLRQLELRGDTLSTQYQNLRKELEHINNLELRKPEIERWYASISDSVNKLQSMRRWDGWQAGSWLRENNMLPSWMKPFTYLHSGALGRFLLSSLPIQISAPFILNGTEVVGQYGSVELGFHGGWSEGVIPPWREISGGWRIGGFMGLNNDLAHFRVGITYWIDSLSKHSLPYITIQRLSITKNVMLSGGAAQYTAKQKDTIYLITEGVSQPTWAIKKGNAYWTDLTVSSKFFHITTGFSYYDKAFSHPTLPWTIPGRLSIHGNIKITIRKWHAFLGTRQFRYLDTLWGNSQRQGIMFLGTGFNSRLLSISLIGQLTSENQYLLSGTALSNLKRWTLAATSTVSTGML